MADDRRLCPFCRTPEVASDGEILERIKKRVVADDAVAIHQLGCLYSFGSRGLPQDVDKAMELWHRAGELGCAEAHYNIAVTYDHGEGVEMDMKKAKHYYELAAMGGNVFARHFLGALELNSGIMNREL